jgi:hypothetical protein
MLQLILLLQTEVLQVFGWVFGTAIFHQSHFGFHFLIITYVSMKYTTTGDGTISVFYQVWAVHAMLLIIGTATWCNVLKSYLNKAL